jgi:hypothetical protein
VKNPFTKIRFIKSPTGVYNLAYCVGEVAEMKELQAKELIDAGFAELVEEPQAPATKPKTTRKKKTN